MARTQESAPLRRGLPPMHPGELLREEVLPALKDAGVGKVDVAKALGVSRRALENIVLEQAAVTPEMALRFGQVFGNGPTLWLNLQTAWDLAQARAKIGAEVDRLPVLHTAEAA